MGSSWVYISGNNATCTAECLSNHSLLYNPFAGCQTTYRSYRGCTWMAVQGCRKFGGDVETVTGLAEECLDSHLTLLGLRPTSLWSSLEVPFLQYFFREEIQHGSRTIQQIHSVTNTQSWNTVGGACQNTCWCSQALVVP